MQPLLLDNTWHGPSLPLTHRLPLVPAAVIARGLTTKGINTMFSFASSLQQVLSLVPATCSKWGPPLARGTNPGGCLRFMPSSGMRVTTTTITTVTGGLSRSGMPVATVSGECEVQTGTPRRTKNGTFTLWMALPNPVERALWGGGTLYRSKALRSPGWLSIQVQDKATKQVGGKRFTPTSQRQRYSQRTCLGTHVAMGNVQA